MKKEILIAPPDVSGMRLDVFLTREKAPFSRAALQRMIDDGAITMGGVPVKASLKLKGGESLEILLPEIGDISPDLLPWDRRLKILAEDEHFLAIEKPAGMVTHPGAGNRDQTLANILVSMRPGIAGVGHVLRPGIVHRLDRETSGLMLVAKTMESYHAFSRLFREREMEKHYRAFAFGTFRSPELRIEKALGRDPADRKKISVRARKTRNAITIVHVLRQLDYAALLDVEILTGRTHQIRVHLLSENHPIVGDTKYGGAQWPRIPDSALRSRLKAADFFGLHSYSLDFAHPFTGEATHLECPVPAEWNFTTETQSSER